MVQKRSVISPRKTQFRFGFAHPRIAALGYHDLLEPMGDEKYGLLLAIEGGLVLLGFLWYLRWHALMDKQQKLKKPAPLLQALTLRGNKKLGRRPQKNTQIVF